MRVAIVDSELLVLKKHRFSKRYPDIANKYFDKGAI